MLTKGGSRPRGRPRAYDGDKALKKARDAFWRGGYSGTSLDDLSAATGMKRPSLYGAFGDKSAIYRATLDRYRTWGLGLMEAALDPARPLRQSLIEVYGGALGIYFPVDGAARGCFLVGTAATEAMTDTLVRRILGNSLRDFDAVFEKRFRAAGRSRELARGADPAVLAKMASAVLHSLAIRSRAGDAREDLETFAAQAVEMICGPAASTPRSRSRQPLHRSRPT